LLFLILSAGVLAFNIRGRAFGIDKFQAMDRPAKIYPDYSSTVVPPNIAPLNFMVQEMGSYYFAKIYSDKGTPIEISGRSPKILIPINRWHDLLDKNRGCELRFDIFVKTDGAGWIKFAAITNKIANENVDDYLVYRRLHPTHTHTLGRIGLFQRNLNNFDEKLILDNRGNVITCVNCHAFGSNQPDRATIGVRCDKLEPRTLLINDAVVSKVDAKFGYTSWHPSGKLVTFSIDFLPPMFLHTVRDEVRDTFDANSAIACFTVDSKIVKAPQEISKKERMETWPAWSGDGRYLYFCTTPITWTYQEKKFPPEGYDKLKYDLVRASYDIEKDKWGESEPVLSSKDTGLSISMPKVSPDNHWLVCCMHQYGYFSTWQQSSDLYIVELKSAEKTGRFEYRRLECNTDQSESWHTWSSNSRWIVFSSKGMNGAFTRSCISYIDENGKAYKSIVLPQKDPEFYNYCLETFNVPEFITGPITVTGERLAKIARGSAGISIKIPITGATPKTVVAPKSDHDTHE